MTQLRTISLRSNPKPKKMKVKRKSVRRRKSVHRRPAAKKEPAKHCVIQCVTGTGRAYYWRHGKWTPQRAKAERFGEGAAIEQKDRIAHERKHHRAGIMLQVLRA